MNFGRPEIFHSGDKFRGYVVERLLGNGSLGAVYLVRHELLDTVYALKALFPEVAKENSDYVKRFLREAKIATRIRHPNLVAVHDCGFDEARGIYFIVMDYVSGGDLRQALAFAGKFAPARAVEVVARRHGQARRPRHSEGRWPARLALHRGEKRLRNTRIRRPRAGARRVGGGCPR